MDPTGLCFHGFGGVVYSRLRRIHTVKPRLRVVAALSGRCQVEKSRSLRLGLVSCGSGYIRVDLPTHGLGWVLIFDRGVLIERAAAGRSETAGLLCGPPLTNPGVLEQAIINAGVPGLFRTGSVNPVSVAGNYLHIQSEKSRLVRNQPAETETVGQASTRGVFEILVTLNFSERLLRRRLTSAVCPSQHSKHATTTTTRRRCFPRPACSRRCRDRKTSADRQGLDHCQWALGPPASSLGGRRGRPCRRLGHERCGYAIPQPISQKLFRAGSSSSEAVQ